MTTGFGSPNVLNSGWVRWACKLAGTLGIFASFATLHAQAEIRTLEIFNIHTKETNSVTFKRNGRYDREGLKRLNQAMRDWRLDISIKMDPELFDLLWEVKTELGHTGPIHLISGHRSQKTNNMLRRTRGGQAKRSLHVKGSAADVFFPGVSVKKLRNAALVKQKGGVGYYPRSGQPFVHMDTGRVRHWPRISNKVMASILRNGTSKVPVRRVAETAVAILDAPSPKQKPLNALTSQPAPFALASLQVPTARRVVTQVGNGANQPARNLISTTQRPTPRANPIQPTITPAANVVVALADTPTGSHEFRPSDWGESWLAPTRRNRSPAPRHKPSLGAASGFRTASLLPETSQDNGLSTATIAGYANEERPQASPSGRLLDGTSSSLAGMLADAERLSALSALGADAETTEVAAVAPVTDKLRPTLSSAQSPSARAPSAIKPMEQPDRPIYTAALSPGAFLPSQRRRESRFRAVLFAPAHAHVFEPTPRITQTLSLGVAGRNALAFHGGLFASTEVGSFAPVRTQEGYKVSSLRVVEAGRETQDGFFGFARKALAWLTGN